MNLFESLRVSLRGLVSNKMRSALTMLGIIIGVAVVILVVAIGQGATKRVTDTVNSLGTNLLSIFPGQSRIRITAATATAAAGSKGGSSSMTLKDAEVIAENFKKSVDAVAPQVRDNVQVRMNGKDASTNLTGSSLEYPYVNNVEVDHGRYFTQEEMDGSQKVCVAGVTIADKLTGDPKTDLTGQVIAINRQQFKVVGMLAPKGAGAWGQDQDDVVIVPITTAMRRILNRRFINFMSIRCISPETMPLAQEQISTFLRNRHHLTPPFPDNDDFNIRSQTDLMASQQSVTGTMTTLLSCVAIISLIVGGIGIMNIMLVSVTERTREIGIRKAIGATPRDILMQFLIESAILSLLGGIIGIGLGVGGSMLLASIGGWNTIVSSSAIIAAVVVSAGVGIFFGIYPASKAAALHPIEALRYE
ncbi:MAG: ABC-type antimicrobial peptide transport system,permease component [Chthonomonadales bacterium]|nr:ABC-type antimicrobial peptide transport system,permease component [Chthonomonadales bacterium]